MYFKMQFYMYLLCTYVAYFLRIKSKKTLTLNLIKFTTLGPPTVLPRLVLSSDQCSQRNFPNPHLVLFWSLIEIVFPQISALFWPISNSAPSISALFLLAQKERCPRTQCIRKAEAGKMFHYLGQFSQFLPFLIHFEMY